MNKEKDTTQISIADCFDAFVEKIRSNPKAVKFEVENSKLREEVKQLHKDVKSLKAEIESVRLEMQQKTNYLRDALERPRRDRDNRYVTEELRSRTMEEMRRRAMHDPYLHRLIMESEKF